ncbi:nucleotidyltransferase family protein [Pacificibacter sp. AS14]|uniref:nucleotidyltransferase family protein n=1 Tax=Pacificibacter sp. AS14 TaxID=3135785 RepID=UPI00316D6A11
MFFCAGRGTRMLELTQHQPKPMITVAGRPLIDHAIEAMGDMPRRFANLHYHPEVLEKHLNLAGIDPIFETDLLETGGGLKHALPQLDRDAVFTMNTDAVWAGPKPAKFLRAHWNPDIMDALMLLIPKDNAVGHKRAGDFLRAPDGTLTRGTGDVYTGLQIIKTKYVSEIEQSHFSLNLAWETLLARGTLYGAVYSGHWCDLGHPEAIPLAESMLEHHL